MCGQKPLLFFSKLSTNTSTGIYFSLTNEPIKNCENWNYAYHSRPVYTRRPRSSYADEVDRRSNNWRDARCMAWGRFIRCPWTWYISMRMMSCMCVRSTTDGDRARRWSQTNALMESPNRSRPLRWVHWRDHILHRSGESVSTVTKGTSSSAEQHCAWTGRYGSGSNGGSSCRSHCSRSRRHVTGKVIKKNWSESIYGPLSVVQDVELIDVFRSAYCHLLTSWL